MLKKLVYLMGITVVLSAASTGHAVVVGDWEGNMDGWELAPDTPAASTTEYSDQGVTLGAQSLKVTIPEGGWKNGVRLNINAQGLAQAFEENREFSIDITRLAADWTGEPENGHSGIHFIINAGGDGWSIWEQTDYMGWWKYDQGDQTQTITWDYSSALPQIQFDNLWWLELWIISNYDAAYTTGGVYYLDNAQFVGAPVDISKSTDTVIGNWEQEMDGWVVGGGADALFNDTNGVTLDNYSLDIYLPNGDWNQDVLTLDVIGNGLLDIFLVNQQVSVDVTRLVADWPTDQIPGWNGIHMIINAGGNNWSLWQNMGYRAGWQQTNGDQTQTATWDYAQYFGEMDVDDLTWLELKVVSNANDPAYTGWVLFYLDNMRLFGGGRALNPQPADTTVDVPIDTTLSWTTGTFATSHHLYFGTDSVKVSDANMASDPDVLFVELDDASFDPNGLEFKTQYFWRVDEVNEANPDSPWKGPVWSFTTANFIVVDDFEDYNDFEPDRIFDTWGDGFNVDENGAQVGYDVAPFTEQTIIHGGAQSMPLSYDNTGAALLSEGWRVWDEPQDWTINGFNALKLYIHGDPQNTAGQLYVVIEDSAGMSARVDHPDTAIFTAEEWAEWAISLDDVAADGVDVTAVTKLVIGVADLSDQVEAKGILYIDDIRVGFEAIGLVAYYALENNTEDSSGNGHHGTLAGDPNFPVAYVDGPAGFGAAMLFDGAGGHQHVDLGTFNPSAATDQLSIALWAKWDGPSDSWQGLIGKRHGGTWDRAMMMWQIEADRNGWIVKFQREGNDINTGQMLPADEWIHVAATFDGTTAKVYFDGVVVQEGNFSFGTDTEAPVQIGAATGGGGNPFNGTLDEVRLYDIPLSEAEILELAGQ